MNLGESILNLQGPQGPEQKKQSHRSHVVSKSGERHLSRTKPRSRPLIYKGMSGILERSLCSVYGAGGDW